MIDKDTVKLLRFPFSLLLMPVYWFALSGSGKIDLFNAGLIFIILHFLIWPASNGYNSYIDKDEGSIGGLKHPPKPTKKLFYVTLLMDIAGVLLSLIIGPVFAGFILIYVLISRAYSSRTVRLKKYPIIGLLTVAFFQGIFTYFAVYIGVNPIPPFPVSSSVLTAGTAASLFLAVIYPLTQIYQHEEDRKNGDTTLSMLLGYRGTFVFSSVLFLAAGGVLFYYFIQNNQLNRFIIIMLIMLPAVLFFIFWFLKVLRNKKEANFDNTMKMNGLIAVSINTAFIVLTFLNYYQNS